MQNRLDIRPRRKRVVTRNTQVWNEVVEPFLPSVVHTNGMESLHELVSINIRKAIVMPTSTTTKEATHILGINGPWFLMNGHPLKGHNNATVRVISEGGFSNPITYRDVTISSTNAVELSPDLLLVKWAGPLPCRTIRGAKKFPHIRESDGKVSALICKFCSQGLFVFSCGRYPLNCNLCDAAVSCARGGLLRPRRPLSG